MQKRTCYGNYRKTGCDLKLLKAIAKSRIDGVPLRINKKQDWYLDLTQGWYDCKYNYVQKSWKYQTKVRKQWMKYS